jgi:hypothetical protein
MEERKHDILKWIIVGLLAIVAIVLVFGLGVFVGEKKAKFSYLWAENYHRMYAGPKAGFLRSLRMPPFPTFDEFIEGHGTFGEIIKIEGNNLVVKGRGNVEKVIIVTEKTVIKSGREDIKFSDLKIGDVIVIIGSPNDKGQIEAKLIRIFPPKTGFRGIKFYE